ncbi:hypothetical protein CROQUDRAFT_97983 [Cronartium quercuum f. sp. fusiforme G11]|uniref:Uncharacterized protein n=1 Tax=Cronartium quercuum f. sp. fusiforme G11 TaxID=708437 RepID=A0A9P6NAK4_9BASI|nr:hypothetical protein CROQUDRAFT_97983 [Cronartium quercuum f. sp. fusiforme G11]
MCIALNAYCSQRVLLSTRIALNTYRSRRVSLSKNKRLRRLNRPQGSLKKPLSKPLRTFLTFLMIIEKEKVSKVCQSARYNADAEDWSSGTYK